MKTAAIYSRYSSELQSERSIEDQVELCKSYAAREGFFVTGLYDDRAQSGSNMSNRVGLASLLRDAGYRLFSHVVVESLDRLARDQGDLSKIYKQLNFLGIEIWEVHGGKATPLNTAVRGLMGALQLVDIADKTRRGQSGRVRDGKSAGGRAYGYKSVPGKPGELEIVEHEAEAIRRVFYMFAEGNTPRTIAGMLNAELIPPPRGAHWNASTINGSRQRANGILGNDLYRGVRVWNKVRMLKNPETGRRVSRPNPETQWQRREVPELRIVPEDLWMAVDQRRQRIRNEERSRNNYKVRHLFSGLLKCHQCGGSLVVRDYQGGKTRIGCSTHKESRTCGNNRVMSMTRLEAGILAALRTELEHPDLISAYVAEYNAERKRLAAGRRKSRSSMESRLTTVTGAIERTVDLMIKGIVAPERHATRLHELEAEEKRLKAELALQEPDEVLALHPAAIDRYRHQLDTLQAEFVAGGEPANALRALISRVKVFPNYVFEIEGRLGELLGLPTYPDGKMSGGVVVAGEGFEPPTPGL